MPDTSWACSGWAAAWKRQLANLRFFDGPLSWIGLFLAVVLSRCGSWIEQQYPRENSTSDSPSPRGLQNFWCRRVGGDIGGAACWLGTSVVLVNFGDCLVGSRLSMVASITNPQRRSEAASVIGSSRPGLWDCAWRRLFICPTRD